MDRDSKTVGKHRYRYLVSSKELLSSTRTYQFRDGSVLKINIRVIKTKAAIFIFRIRYLDLRKSVSSGLLVFRLPTT